MCKLVSCNLPITNLSKIENGICSMVVAPSRSAHRKEALDFSEIYMILWGKFASLQFDKNKSRYTLKYNKLLMILLFFFFFLFSTLSLQNNWKII